jgi:hypothetical protein
VADQKISALTAGDPSLVTDEIPVSRTADSLTRKVTALSVARLLAGQTVVIGDIPYASATAAAWGRIAAVATGQVLTSAGVNTAPAWSATTGITGVGTIGTGVWQGTVVAGLYGGTGLATAAIGDIMYASATTPTWSRLAGVATGRVLISGGVDTAPSWSQTTGITTVGTIVSGTWQGTAVTGLYGGTGLATAAVGDLMYASATTPVWSRLAAGTVNFVLTSGGAGIAPSWAAAGSGSSRDLATSYWIEEDFLSAALFASSGEYPSGVWHGAGGGTPITSSSTVRGGRRIVGDDDTTVGRLSLYDKLGGGVYIVFAKAADNFTLQIRAAQVGTGAGTRRFGAPTVEFANADQNGIYFRHTNAGAITLVCRSGGTESTLSSGTNAANGVYYKCKVVVTGTTNAQFWFDGVDKGAITTNIPSVDLGLDCGGGSTASTSGLDIDYISIVGTR